MPSWIACLRPSPAIRAAIGERHVDTVLDSGGGDDLSVEH